MELWPSGGAVSQQGKSSKSRTPSAGQMGNAAGCSTARCRSEMGAATSSSGMDRVWILRNAKQRKNCSGEIPKRCKETSFISPKGSVLATWEAGPSSLLDSTTGLLNYFEYTDSIRPANRLVFRNTWIVSTHRIASPWQI